MNMVDIHSHFLPRSWPDLAARFGPAEWPWMKHTAPGEAMLMLGYTAESFGGAHAGADVRRGDEDRGRAGSGDLGQKEKRLTGPPIFPPPRARHHPPPP